MREDMWSRLISKRWTFAMFVSALTFVGLFAGSLTGQEVVIIIGSMAAVIGATEVVAKLPANNKAA